MAVAGGVIPKEQLSAYQRWELAALLPAEGDAVGSPPVEEESGRRQDAELECLRAAAAAQGHAAGRAEGLAGAATDVARLAALLHALGSTVRDHDQRLADGVLDLALAFARQLAGEALSVRRELLMPIIAAALAQLPEATQRVRLHLDPADVELVRTLMDAHPGLELCQLVADTTVTPGGFRLDTEQCEVDGTLPTRWKRLSASLGRSYEWLDHS
jgi:flagellar assembly protein FliH